MDLGSNISAWGARHGLQVAAATILADPSLWVHHLSHILECTRWISPCACFLSAQDCDVNSGQGSCWCSETSLVILILPFCGGCGLIWGFVWSTPLLSLTLSSNFLQGFYKRFPKKPCSSLYAARSASAVDMSANRTTEHSTPQEHLLGVGPEGGSTMQVSSRANPEVRSAELRERGKPTSGRLGCWGAVQAPGTETLAEDRPLGHPAGENNASFSSLSPGYLSVRVAQCCTSWWR